MDSKTITFSSGRDFVGLLSFWGLPSGFFVWFVVESNTLRMLLYHPSKNAVLTFMLFLVFWAGIFLFLLWFYRGTKYTITKDKLIIEIGGYLVDEIKIRAIKRVSRSYNPLATSATSIKRIWIYNIGNQKVALISPTPEKNFLAELLKRNPKIKLVNLKNP